MKKKLLIGIISFSFGLVKWGPYEMKKKIKEKKNQCSEWANQITKIKSVNDLDMIAVESSQWIQ